MSVALPQPGETIRVLLADDSPMMRRYLSEVITGTPDMKVVGEAANGLETVRLSAALQPHIIAMEVHLPIMDGLQAAEIIMQETPTRIVMLGKKNLEENDLLGRLTAIGVLDFCEKPAGLHDEETAQNLVKTLRAMAHVGVIRRMSRDVPPALLAEYPGLLRRLEIVLIVSSTGGPHALEDILKRLPDDFPLPVVIVQHISGEFMGNMLNWLDTSISLPIKMAEHGERPQPGTIYIAPGGVHLRFAYNGRFALDKDTEGYLHIPSGDVMLESAAAVYGGNGIGIILTGMGRDGAKGLLRMREKGAHTIVQDESTSIVFGMPKAAIELGGSEYVEPLENIAGRLLRLVKEG